MDLSHLVCNNDPPDPSEIPAISASLVDLILEQHRLQLQLDEIEEKVEQHLAALSAVRKVPLEILSDIFLLAVFGTNREDYSSSRVMYPDIRERVATLGLVCRHWRRATLITNVFWSHVAVDCPLRGQLWPDIAYEKVGTWLSHQDVLPRTLEFGSKYCGETCCGEYEDDECRYQSESLGRLLAEGPALHKLILRLESPDCFERLVNSFPAPANGWTDANCPWPSFRQLNTIQLRFESWLSEPEYGPEHSCFDSLPPVKNLELYLPRQRDAFEGESEGYEECDEAEITIPRAVLEGLKEFTFSCNWTPRHTIGPLVHCKNLEKLVLCFKNLYAEWRHPLPNTSPLVDHLSSSGISLPKLRTLQVKKCKWQVEIEHLKFFRTPAMETLDIELDSDGNNWVKVEDVQLWWTPLVARIDCLRTLCLRDMYFERKAFVEMGVHEFPALMHLTLEWVEPLEELFGGTAPFSNTKTERGGRPFPALQSLELLGLQEEFDFGLVFDFVKNRRAHRMCVVDGREELVFEGPPDTIKSVIAKYDDLTKDPEARVGLYRMAWLLNNAGVAVTVCGPSK